MAERDGKVKLAPVGSRHSLAHVRHWQVRMFGIDPMVIAFVLLAGFSAGGIAYAFLFNNLENEKAGIGVSVRSSRPNGSQRRQGFRDRMAETAKRRKTVQDSLKELDAKQAIREGKTTKPPLSVQIRQAGHEDLGRALLCLFGHLRRCGDHRRFHGGAPLYVLPGVLLIAGIGLPRWFIIMRRKARVRRFLEEFPNALDIIVRAVKSGLPLNDGIRLIANEVAGAGALRVPPHCRSRSGSACRFRKRPCA